MHVHIGVDVGGTNTDAVVLFGKTILAAVKCVTTPDVTTGVTEAIKGVLAQAKAKEKTLEVRRVHIGTTHFVNAVVQRRNLRRVAVIRLCLPASTSLPPFCDFPEDLKEELCGGVFLLSGGYQFDGQEVISNPSEDEIVSCLQQLKEDGIFHIAINSIFSPVNASHEIWAKEVIQKHYPEASITLSHCVGSTGLLERENAAILNESVKPLCEKTIAAFREALHSLGLACPFYITQNDGTLLSAEQALEMPVHTFASGPTNSMRGAAFLSGVKDAVVVDIGGTSTDVGALVAGFPREASTAIEVGGVRTNFRMPDVPSIGLGGGSLVQPDKESVKIGPQSVGYRLSEESMVFGGNKLTASDIAVAAGLAQLGNMSKVAHIESNLVSEAVKTWHIMLEDLIDSIKTSESDIPVILVGGGSVLIDISRKMKGVCKLIKPAYFQVANAVGAALSQVSGSVDKVISLASTSRSEAIDNATKQAEYEAIKAGANPATLETVEIADTPLSYLPGNATRIKVKVVGDLKEKDMDTNLAVLQRDGPVEQEDLDIVYEHNARKMASKSGCAQSDHNEGNTSQETLKGSSISRHSAYKEPSVDPKTGEWVLSEWDADCLAVGTGILGCGGGFSVYIGKLRVKRAIREGKVIRVVTPERISKTMKDGDVVVPLGFMGAPVIMIEKIPNDKEILTTFKHLMDLYKYGQYHNGTLTNPGTNIVESKEGVSCIDDFKPYHSEEEHTRTDLNPVPNPVGVTLFEIGGSNAFDPLLIGAELDLPIVDCDGMGRAFPELQMVTPFMFGADCYPVCLADESDRVSVILKAETPKHLEDYSRGMCIKYGCTAGVAWPFLSKKELTDMMIPHSLSRAWRLGNAVLQAGRMKVDPIQVILDHEGGKILITGKICDVLRETVGGFNRGRLRIVGFWDFNDRTLLVDFQNENLVATMLTGEEKKVLACTPDLISVVITETGVPVQTEEVRYGLRVSVLVLSAPPMLCKPQALEVIGPQAFGYPASQVQFNPIGKYIAHDPVPYI